MLAEPEAPLPAEETPEELEATEAPPDPEERLLDEEDPPGAAPADPLALAPDLDPAEPPPRAFFCLSNSSKIFLRCSILAADGLLTLRLRSLIVILVNHPH